MPTNMAIIIIPSPKSNLVIKKLAANMHTPIGVSIIIPICVTKARFLPIANFFLEFVFTAISPVTMPLFVASNMIFSKNSLAIY